MNKLIFVSLFLLASVFAASAQSIIVEYSGKQTTVGKAELAKLKSSTLKVLDHGTPATFEGVLVADILKLGGVEFGEKLRGKRAAEYVIVEAADGYKAVYSIVEFDPSFTDKLVILADRRDGKELPENARSFQVVNDSDKRAARWVRQVIKFRVLAAN